uniref:Uncharacterized protein n=1 Tax=Eutreptiella gymnastica TaxID=73025 RepID=A0A6T2IZL4_9EUGL
MQLPYPPCAVSCSPTSTDSQDKVMRDFGLWVCSGMAEVFVVIILPVHVLSVVAEIQRPSILPPQVFLSSQPVCNPLTIRNSFGMLLRIGHHAGSKQPVFSTAHPPLAAGPLPVVPDEEWRLSCGPVLGSKHEAAAEPLRIWWTVISSLCWALD